MNTLELLKNIGGRTNNDIYVGVVGPVRTGKSTFIRKFMELVVLDNITDESEKKRATDELPQAGLGKQIMTCEPKFVPNNAVSVKVDEELFVNVRLVDCVGYVFKDALGHTEGESPRMVKTPWFEQAIAFDEAAKVGTNKVINDHSTIGVLVTTDGSIVDIDRESYVDAEQEPILTEYYDEKPIAVARQIKIRGQIYGRSEISQNIGTLKTINASIFTAILNMKNTALPPMGVYSNSIMNGAEVDNTAGGITVFDTDVMLNGAQPIFPIAEQGDVSPLFNVLTTYLKEEIAKLKGDS